MQFHKIVVQPWQRKIVWSRSYTFEKAQVDIGATHNIYKVNRVLLCCKLILFFLFLCIGTVYLNY